MSASMVQSCQYLLLRDTIVFYCFSAPSVSVRISGGDTPTAGQNYQLICSVTGADNINPSTTFRWTRNSGTEVQVGAELSFTPLRLADAASYVCEVTIASSFLSEDIVEKNVNPQNISIQSEY